MAKVERIYNVPLRKGFLKAVRYKKAKKAVTTLKEFLAKHMKADIKDIRLGKNVNHKIWEQGIKSPPHHVKVSVVKEDSGVVKAELFGFKYDEPKPGDDKKDEKKAKEEPKVPVKKDSKITETKETPKDSKKTESKPKIATKDTKTETKKSVAKKPAAKKSSSAKKKPSKK